MQNDSDYSSPDATHCHVDVLRPPPVVDALNMASLSAARSPGKRLSAEDYQEPRMKKLCV